MQPNMSWYQTLAWKFFSRQAAAILVLMSIILWVAYNEAERGARNTANTSLSGGGYVLERAFEQQGRSMDAGLDVFTQYSGNLALIEQALEAGTTTSLTDTLIENLPRLGAEVAIVVRPDGTMLAGSARGMHQEFRSVGIIQMALAPDEAKAAGHPGPFYRGFFHLDWGDRPGVYHAVARPLRSPGGKSLGAMLVAIRVDDRAAADFRRLAIAGPQRGDPSAQLVLLSQFRALGTTLPEGEAMNRLLARETAFLAIRGQVLDGQRSNVLPFRLEKQTYLGVIAPLRGVNALDLEMAYALLMPVEPLLAPFRNLQRAILAIGAAGIFIALGLSLRSARSVTAPLNSLVTAAKALAEGEAPDTLDIVATQDEVGLLTRTFRTMVAELRAKDDLLALLETTRRSIRTRVVPLAPASTLPLGIHNSGRGLEAAIQSGGPVLSKDERDSLPAALQEGTVFAARYRIDGVLGRGGMGIVLKVQDLQLDEAVALKVVRAELASDPAFLERLKQEIRLARKISNRHVLRTHDFGESDGIPFVTMEYLKGVTLRGLLDGRGHLPLPLALRVTRQVAEGLEAAHAVGVVHRDIKPANVLFDIRGDAKIMDFGLAAPAMGMSPGDADTLVGSPRYMSPEQIRGEQVDARTDLYALGIMLFELCSGAPPYDCPSIKDLLSLHLVAPVPFLGEWMPGVSPDLNALIHRLMEKRKEDRPQSATEVVEILKVLVAFGGGTSLA